MSTTVDSNTGVGTKDKKNGGQPVVSSKGSATLNGEPYTPRKGETVMESDGDPLVWDGTQFMDPDEYKTQTLLDRQVSLGEEALGAQKEVSAAQIEIARAEEERAAKEYENYEKYYLPGEIAWAKASFAGIPVEQELAWASSGVNQSFDTALEQASRELQGYGVDPSSPKFAQMTSDFALAKSAADAGARNAARKEIRDTNYERQRQAVLVGRDKPATSSGISRDASAAYSGASSALASGYNAAGGALYNSAALINDNYQKEKDRDSAAEMAKWGAIGSIGGGVAEAGVTKLLGA